MATLEARAIETATEIANADGLARELISKGESNLAECYLRCVAALREIAHGTSGLGPATDAATMQTTARMALGEIAL